MALGKRVRLQLPTNGTTTNGTSIWIMVLLNGIIFLDLKKAFDCVDLDILIKKLSYFGCKGTTLNWFRSYLTNRKQMCKVNQVTSQPRTIRCSVPQG